MIYRLAALVFSMVFIYACQGVNSSAQSPAAPSATLLSGVGATDSSTSAPQAAADVARPFKASATWTALPPTWAGQPGVDKSDFNGRCSVPSDYIISAMFEGEATHAGRVTGSTSHCSQIEWTPLGPGRATYSDGRGVMTSANGSTILLRYDNGTTGFDPASQQMWFRDTWTFTGGTGLFEGATGSGEEGGSFTDFNQVLGGLPVSMWMEGTITYNPSRK